MVRIIVNCFIYENSRSSFSNQLRNQGDYFPASSGHDGENKPLTKCQKTGLMTQIQSYLAFNLHSLLNISRILQCKVTRLVKRVLILQYKFISHNESIKIVSEGQKKMGAWTD